MTNRFDRFTSGARDVLQYAQEEAQLFHHSYLGAEHILLGLLRNENELAAKVLANLNVDRHNVRDAIETIAGRGQSSPGEIGLTARAKKVLEITFEEARRLNVGAIGTEHLLLGIFLEGQNAGFVILQSMSVTLERVQAEIALLYAELAPPEEPEPEPEEPETDVAPEDVLPTEEPVAEVEVNEVGESSSEPEPLAHLSTPVAEPDAATTQTPKTPALNEQDILRTAPNTGLATAAGAALSQARVVLSLLSNDDLTRALVDSIVIGEICQLEELLDLKTLNRLELEDAHRRIRQALDLLNRVGLALQGSHPVESLALVAASAAVQRALAR